MKSIAKIKDFTISRIASSLPDDITGIAYSAKEKAVAFYCECDGSIGFIDENGVRFVPRRLEIPNPIGMCCDKWGIIMLQTSHDMLWSFNQSFEDSHRFCGESLFHSTGKTWPSDVGQFAPLGICRTASNMVLVTTTWGHKVVAIRNGNVEYVIGIGKKGFATSNSMSAAKFDMPTGICFDARSETILISDTGNKVVRLFKNSKELACIGMPGTEGKSDGTGYSARMTRPTAIATESGIVAVADGNLVRKFTTASLDVSTPYASPYRIVDIAMGDGCIYTLEDSL